MTYKRQEDAIDFIGNREAEDQRADQAALFEDDVMDAEAKTLRWEGSCLYAKAAGRREEYVGAGIRNAFVDTWGVYVRGEHKHDFNSEASARRQLEEYA